jgi:hypothetical protein
MLLYNHNYATATTFSTTDADASDTATTSKRTQDCAEHCAKEQQQPQQSEHQEQRDPDQHHYHLGASRHVQRRTPKKGRDIGNALFVESVKLLI